MQRAIQPTSRIQEQYEGLSSRARALLIGAAIGITGGLIAVGMASIGPIFTTAIVLGLLAGLYILTNIAAALYAVIAVVGLLPFATVPFRLGLTPTFLDLAMGAFVLVYLFQWMTGRRHTLRLTPIHALLGLYIMWLLLAFALGLRHAPPTSAILRQFAETLLSLSLVFVLVDLLRDHVDLRRLVLIFTLIMGLQAVVTIGLYVMPDDLAERTLVRLARIGYPDGGVIRYIEDNPEMAERAIGTWVDPNALGGILAAGAALIAPQIFAQKPVLRWRFLGIMIAGLVVLALILTFSRASLLAFVAGMAFIGVIRYRRLLPLIFAGGLLLLLLPQTQLLIERLLQAFSGADLATQMRIGEYTDSLRLISRYPIFGVGFTGTPDSDIYSHVASFYLIMANQIGLVGLFIFLGLMAGVFYYGLHAWPQARADTQLEALHLGAHAALLTALVNAAADLYFFRLDFHPSITFFWLLVALALASSRLIRDRHPVKR